jgi:hypothetical protein
MKYYSVFAQAYGQGDYGNCTYNENTSQCITSAGAGTGGSNNGGGGLANTGISLVALLTIACLIVFVALMVRIWRRKPATQEVETIEDADTEDEKRLADRY